MFMLVFAAIDAKIRQSDPRVPCTLRLGKSDSLRITEPKSARVVCAVVPVNLTCN